MASKKARNWIGLATLTWRFEAEATDTESHQLARQQFEEMLGKIIPEELKEKVTIKVKAQRCAERVSKKARVGGPYNPDEILPQRMADDGSRPKDQEFLEFKGEGDEVFKVSMVSQRYHIFARDNCTCQACGLKGDRLYLERDRSTKEGRAHFNLYAIEDGKEVLFTKDHILAASKGGPSHLSNLQTYCSICNLLKGRHQITNAQVAELRKVYAEKKKLHPNTIVQKIKEMNKGIGNDANFGKKKIKLVQAAEAKQKALEPRLKASVSLAIMSQPNNGKVFVAYPWAELRDKTRKKAVKVLEAGTVLQVNRSSASAVVCFLDEEGTKVSIPHRLLEAVDGATQEVRHEDQTTQDQSSGIAGHQVRREGAEGGGELGREQPEGVVGGA